MATRARDGREDEESARRLRGDLVASPPATPGGLRVLQRSAGNAAVGRVLARDDGPGAAVGAAVGGLVAGPLGAVIGGLAGGLFDAGPQAVGALAPETKKTTPDHSATPKLGLDLASGEAVLTNAFGKVKKIVPGKIEILDQAAFQAAYDKIYGETQYSWERYVKPTYGSLNGFAHGVSRFKEVAGFRLRERWGSLGWRGRGGRRGGGSRRALRGVGSC